jgi:hypothetical protein
LLKFNLRHYSIRLDEARRDGFYTRHRDAGGTSDQRMQSLTARWPWVPNSRWQLSLMRSGICSGASGPQAVKRTSGNIKRNIRIWLRGRQSGPTCQAHNSSTKFQMDLLPDEAKARWRRQPGVILPRSFTAANRGPLSGKDAKRKPASTRAPGEPPAKIMPWPATCKKASIKPMELR